MNPLYIADEMMKKCAFCRTCFECVLYDEKENECIIKFVKPCNWYTLEKIEVFEQNSKRIVQYCSERECKNVFLLVKRIAPYLESVRTNGILK